MKIKPISLLINTGIFIFFLSFSSFALAESPIEIARSGCCYEHDHLRFSVAALMRNYSSSLTLSGYLSAKVVDPQGGITYLGAHAFGPLSAETTVEINFDSAFVKDRCDGQYLVVFDLNLDPNANFDFEYIGDVIISNPCNYSQIDVPFDSYSSGTSTLNNYQFQVPYYFSCDA